jgi:mono/diheme cytochrome c family protein
MRRLLLAVAALIVLGFAAFYLITAPKPRAASEFAGLTGDAKKGEQVFWASGCASCHAAPDAKGDALLVLAGGKSFVTGFGTFIAPNVSPDPKAGIGGWDVLTFANAVMAGVTPTGQHEYPAMPYSAYAKMAPQDLVDLKAFMDTLPASPQVNPGHALGFPFNLRLALGAWKFLFLKPDFVIAGDPTPEQTRGRYIAEALAHCGECHTPRNALGGLDTGKWLAGAPMPDGKGKVPNITPAKLDWSDKDIFTYLTTGATPRFDFVGGAMAEVVTNFSHLPEADVNAVVAYLKAVPPTP